MKIFNCKNEVIAYFSQSYLFNKVLFKKITDIL